MTQFNDQYLDLLYREMLPSSLLTRNSLTPNLDIMFHWVNSLKENSKFSQKSLELTMIYIKHYVANTDLPLNQLKLLVCSALLMATRLHELKSDDLGQEMLQHFNQEQFSGMQGNIASSLLWNLDLLSDYNFDEHTREKIDDIINFVMLHQNFNHLLPSQIFALAYNYCTNQFPSFMSQQSNILIMVETSRFRLKLDQLLGSQDEDVTDNEWNYNDQIHRKYSAVMTTSKKIKKNKNL